VLPLAQVICTQLYDQVERNPADGRVIAQANVDAIGGLKGGIQRHVDHLLQQHLFRAADRKAFQRLLEGSRPARGNVRRRQAHRRANRLRRMKELG
jgi:hypothetical protein